MKHLVKSMMILVLCPINNLTPTGKSTKKLHTSLSLEHIKKSYNLKLPNAPTPPNSPDASAPFVRRSKSASVTNVLKTSNQKILTSFYDQSITPDEVSLLCMSEENLNTQYTLQELVTYNNPVINLLSQDIIHSAITTALTRANCIEHIHRISPTYETKLDITTCLIPVRDKLMIARSFFLEELMSSKQ